MRSSEGAKCQRNEVTAGTASSGNVEAGATEAVLFHRDSPSEAPTVDRTQKRMPVLWRSIVACEQAHVAARAVERLAQDQPIA